MPHSHGYNNGTRDMMSRLFRKSGTIPMSTYLIKYKIGDYVDIKANGAVHDGRPHKGYHGRTGRIFNIPRRAVGVIVHKRLGPRIINKRVHVRVEHVCPSTSRDEIKSRVKANEAAKKAGGAKVNLKRQPAGPRAGFAIKGNPEYRAPAAYVALV